MRKRKPEPPERPKYHPCGRCLSGYVRVIRDGVSCLTKCRCLRRYNGEPIPAEATGVDFKARGSGEAA